MGKDLILIAMFSLSSMAVDVEEKWEVELRAEHSKHMEKILSEVPKIELVKAAFNHLKNDIGGKCVERWTIVKDKTPLNFGGGFAISRGCSKSGGGAGEVTVSGSVSTVKGKYSVDITEIDFTHGF